MRCTPRADNTLLLEGWNPHRWASAAHLVAALRSDPPPEVIEIIPAFEQIAIVYEVTRAPC